MASGRGGSADPKPNGFLIDNTMATGKNTIPITHQHTKSRIASLTSAIAICARSTFISSNASASRLAAPIFETSYIWTSIIVRLLLQRHNGQKSPAKSLFRDHPSRPVRGASVTPASFPFPQPSPPRLPPRCRTARLHTNDGTGMIGSGSALRIARWWHSQQHTSSDRTPLARMLSNVHTRETLWTIGAIPASRNSSRIDLGL